MKKCFYIVLFIVSIFQILSCKEDSGSKKTETTIANNKPNSPAFNRELIIDIAGDTIAGYALIASGKELKETIILISGYPGNDTNYDIGQAIRRNGKNVIQFNHRGAWGSQGKYSYSNCLEDIEKLIAYLREERTSQELRIDIERFTLLGRSYGGGIALIKGSQLEEVKKIIAISTVNYGEIMSRYERLEELGGFKRYMRKQIMMNHDIDEFLQELLERKEDYEILKYKEELKGKAVLLIEDTDKNKDWIDQIESSENVLLETDHNFIDKRIELENLIINWLKKH